MLPLPSPEDFNYDLPENKIAFEPLKERDASKLLMYRDGKISDHVFTDVPDLLPEDSTIFFNETRVVMARIHAHIPVKNRIIEIFCLEAPHGQSVEQIMQQKDNVVFRCLVGGARHWKSETLEIQYQTSFTLRLEMLEREEGTFLIGFSWDADLSFAEILDALGKVPLPPYIRRDANESDFDRYQSIFAQTKGSVAAPTASLHFTENIMQRIHDRGIQSQALTLHVGGGTFLPVKENDLSKHRMHSEEMVISSEVIRTLQNRMNNRIAVGTTSIRFLESLYWLGVKAIHQPESFNWNLEQWDAYELPQNTPENMVWLKLEELLSHGHIYAKTSLMIIPGYTYRVVHAMFTNFHQPKSTLLMLVSGCIGEDWRSVYHHALKNNYRFLSYGDSNLYFFNKAQQA
ncbi:MAG: S-adenosylmethionine:tRNA ribosyltransferase-isomerase [Flavobacteriales bacterium]|nr:MAG: S-adenosylmethionine:tRNA ribosyltransferase-isomerase [Flavobacteriales bacterium]